VALRGSDASHAWVALWCGAEAGWVHLDPTNDLVASQDHVAVAWGRDFSDVSPLRGVILGGESHSYGVDVTLVPTE
jgi:transglutaminase-like putative cysteine protease